MDALEAAGVDSLWLPEMVYGSLVDPFIGMAHALARTSRLKVGTGVAVLPGRHPVLVAKQLATLAGLAPRRVLPVFGLKRARPDQLAFPVPPGRPGGDLRRSEDSINVTGTVHEQASAGWQAGPGALGPWHSADEVGCDQRAVGRIPGQHGVCLSQSDQGGHGCGARGGHVALAVLGHDLNLEPAVIAVWASRPVGVDDLYPSCLFTCAWHGIQ